MNPINPRILNELGLEWPDLPPPLPESARGQASLPKASGFEVPRKQPPAGERARLIQTLSGSALPKHIEACRDCGLGKSRQQSVFGVGPSKAEVLWVGEAPGAEEDERGEPFVGAAGQLLDRMIEAMGLRRETVYIANVVKCRPPGNRTPSPEECATCFPYLARQIALIEPTVIVALGRVAAHSLLGPEFNLGSLRGKVHRYGAIPLVVTYHPAYLLRNLPEKAKAWQDLSLVRAILTAPR